MAQSDHGVTKSQDHQITRSRHARVLVASTRPAKVEAARAAIERIASIDPRFERVSVEALDVGGVAPAMPMSDRETLDGAIARATALAAGAVTPFLALGLEGGMSSLPSSASREEMTLVSWAAATDGRRWGYGCGGAIVVPAPIAHEVRGGRELGDVIDELAAEPVRGTRGAWGVLTRNLIGRRDAFTIATLAALAPFYNSSSYGFGDLVNW
jgi:inosine/xanthosine triphosphatase